MSRTISVRPATDIDRENAHYVTVIEDGHSETYAVGTDRDGRGLWVDGKQVEGTLQFSLHGVADKRGKIRRWFAQR